MKLAMIEQIEERLYELSPDNLAFVLRLVMPLSQRPPDGAFQTMLASEAVPARDCDTPEDDAAWAHLWREMEQSPHAHGRGQ
jgi:hypothetical protein